MAKYFFRGRNSHQVIYTVQSRGATPPRILVKRVRHGLFLDTLRGVVPFSFCVKSTPNFRPSASISVLCGREEGAGLWDWEHNPGREEVGLQGTGSLTSSARVLKITPLLLTYKADFCYIHKSTSIDILHDFKGFRPDFNRTGLLLEVPRVQLSNSELRANSEFPGFVRMEIPKPWKIKQLPSSD